jgi:hypothetical protein
MIKSTYGEGHQSDFSYRVVAFSPGGLRNLPNLIRRAKRSDRSGNAAKAGSLIKYSIGILESYRDVGRGARGDG